MKHLAHQLRVTFIPIITHHKKKTVRYIVCNVTSDSLTVSVICAYNNTSIKKLLENFMQRDIWLTNYECHLQ